MKINNNANHQRCNLLEYLEILSTRTFKSSFLKHKGENKLMRFGILNLEQNEGIPWFSLGPFEKKGGYYEQTLFGCCGTYYTSIITYE